MTTCPVIKAPTSSAASAITAAFAAFALTLLFFWGLAQSSDHLPPDRSVPATHIVA